MNSTVRKTRKGGVSQSHLAIGPPSTPHHIQMSVGHTGGSHSAQHALPSVDTSNFAGVSPITTAHTVAQPSTTISIDFPDFNFNNSNSGPSINIHGSPNEYRTSPRNVSSNDVQQGPRFIPGYRSSVTSMGGATPSLALGAQPHSVTQRTASAETSAGQAPYAHITAAATLPSSGPSSMHTGNVAAAKRHPLPSIQSHAASAPTYNLPFGNQYTGVDSTMQQMPMTNSDGQNNFYDGSQQSISVHEAGPPNWQEATNLWLPHQRPLEQAESSSAPAYNPSIAMDLSEMDHFASQFTLNNFNMASALPTSGNTAIPLPSFLHIPSPTTTAPAPPLSASPTPFSATVGDGDGEDSEEEDVKPVLPRYTSRREKGRKYRHCTPSDSPEKPKKCRKPIPRDAARPHEQDYRTGLKEKNDLLIGCIKSLPIEIKRKDWIEEGEHWAPKKGQALDAAIYVISKVPDIYKERDAARAKCRELEQQLANMSLDRKRVNDIPMPAYHHPMSYTPG